MISSGFLSGTGGVHAVSCEWPVHHGRPCVQFYVHPGWAGVHRPRPGEQTSDAAAEPHPAVVRGFCCRHHCVLHVQGLHAYQAAVSWTVFSSFFPPFLPLSSVLNSLISFSYTDECFVVFKYAS